MAAFVDVQDDFESLRAHILVTEYTDGMGDDWRDTDVDLDPLKGRKRGFITGEKISISSGTRPTGGMKMGG